MPESDPFTAIYLTNPSSADALTLEFLVGTGTVDIVDSRLNVIAARPDVSLLPVGAWKRKQVSLSAGATAAFFASATYGQNAILMAPIGNPNPISAGPTAADKDLIVLDPGASYQVNTGDAMRYNLALWYAYNSGAGACTLEILYV
jgi:fatty acid/phospholipid biosynthesis enzyme